MARIRTIKPEFFTSLTIANLTLEARLTFVGLWTHVDDEGRCVDDARLIKAAVWPLDDRVSADVERDLTQLTEYSLILRYKVGGRSYLAVRSWREHQRINRPTPSKLPAPPETPDPAPRAAVPDQHDAAQPAEIPAQQPYAPALIKPSSSTHTQLTEDSPQERKGTGNREQGKEQGREASLATPAPRQRGTRIPDDFTVTDEMKIWFSANCPGIDGRRETEKFRNYWRAKSGKDATKLDWEATWRNWMLKAADDRRPSASSGASRQPANYFHSTRTTNPFADEES